MTSPYPDAAGPVAGAGRHAGEDLLASYAAGMVGPAAAWSVEAHLTGCASCRSALSAQVDADRLARNRSALLVRAAIGDGGPGAAPALPLRCPRPSAPPAGGDPVVAQVLAAVDRGRAGCGGRGSRRRQARLDRAGRHVGPAGYPDAAAVAPFLLVAPLLVLAGVAAAFLPRFDPAYQLAAAAPFSGFTLLLVRAVCALAGALVPVAGAAFVLPGPGWLPVALLLPSLALCGFALAAATVMGPAPRPSRRGPCGRCR